VPTNKPGFELQKIPLGACSLKNFSCVDADLVKEPQRVADFYRVKSFRLEPVGLAYLWPVTG
jgi:hypothetical protein